MVSAILLAAGQSRRLGGHKALLPFAGTNLLTYQLDQLQQVQGLTEIIVVIGYQGERLLANLERPGVKLERPVVKVVTNHDYAQGKTTSIKAGLKALSHQATAVIILGVDEPRPAGILETLVQKHRLSQALVTIPVYKGKRGHPPIFSLAILPELLAITEEGQGLRQVMKAHQSEFQEVDLDNPLVLVNINTQEDYQKALGLFSA